MNVLRRIYQALPIVREVRTIGLFNSLLIEQTSALKNSLHQLIKLQCADYRDRLLAKPRYADPKCLVRYGQQFFSQGEEDGIIAEILRRLRVARGVFLEIGVGNGLENNTTALLMRGWHGYWFEASDANVRAITREFASPIRAGQLIVHREFVTAENIAGILSAAGVRCELDLMSIDIDRNTYWLWAALAHLRPKVVVVEYNGQVPPDLDWKVPYDPTRVWDGSSCFGAGLKAFELLGNRLGYNLVGCTLNGVNAFFVQKDLCRDLFLEPFTAENHYEPLRLFMLGRSGYPTRFTDSGRA